MSKENTRSLLLASLIFLSACASKEAKGDMDRPMPSPVPVPGTPTDVFEEERSFPEQAEDIPSSDLAYIYQSAELLKMSEYYHSNEKFKELVDGIIGRDEAITINPVHPYKTLVSGVDLSFEGDIKMELSLYIKAPGTEDSYYYLTPAGASALLAHELAHIVQDLELINGIKEKGEGLSSEEQRDLYYQLRTEEIELGVGEIQAVWVGLSVFSELEHLNSWIDDRFQNEVFPGELKLVRTQAELEENGENWQSEKWVNTVAEVYGWNDLQVEEINKRIDSYSHLFK